MARTGRIKFSDRDALHHVTSRISGRQMLLAGPAAKRDMLDALWRAAEFSGVNVGAFALMDNQFHVVVQVPAPEGTVPEERCCGATPSSWAGRRRCGLRRASKAVVKGATLPRRRLSSAGSAPACMTLASS